MKVRITLFSFPFRKFIFLLASILFVLIVMFGCMVVAHAEPLALTPNEATYKNPLYQNPFTPSINLVNNVGYQNMGAYYFAITNPGADSFDFTYHYNATNYCSSTGYKGSATFQYSLEGGVSGSNISVVYDNQTSGITTQKNGSTITIPTLDFSKGVKFVFNSGGGQATGLYIDRGWNITCATDPNQSVIDNNNQNTQDIINNNNNNTNTIINNQNQNTQDMIDSQQVCTDLAYSYSDLSTQGKINGTGVITVYDNWRTTDFISLGSSSTIRTNNSYQGSTNYICFYDSNKGLISCPIYSDGNISIPSGSKYFKISIRSSNQPQVFVFSCKDGNQAINDSLTDDNTSQSTSGGGRFFGDFQINDSTGITAVVTAPLRLFSTMVNNNDSCNAYTFTVNFGSLNKQVSLPSGCILWNNVSSSVILIYNTVIFGLMGYRILIDAYHYLSSLRDPDKKNEFYMDL